MLATLFRRVTGAPARGAAGDAARRPIPRRPAPHARARLFALLALCAFALTTAPALSATEGSTTTTAAEAKQLRAATVAEERTARQVLRHKEAAERRSQLVRKREEERAHKKVEAEERSGSRATLHGFVEISCSSVTWHFQNFGPGSHTVTEIVSIDGMHQPTVLFTFEGASGTNTTPISESASKHRIDAHAKWFGTGDHGGWDISSVHTCHTGGSGFAYTIEKRQRLLDGGGFVTTPLEGEVGETIVYQITVTNTGGEFITFSEFSDPHCDPGTIKGGLEGPLAPGGSARYSCTHVIVTADQGAGSYQNTAAVTGTPFGGGTPVTTPTNTVVVTVPAPGSSKEKEKTGGGGGSGGAGGGGGGGAGTTTNTPGGSTGVLGTSGSQAPGSGALATSSSVPAISGRPSGCARSNFVVSIKSKGVRAVTFYVDNHRLRSLTYRNARAGKLSVHINIAKLRIGVHHVKARITMNPLTASAKAVIATRTITFARCASSTLSPRFTG